MEISEKELRIIFNAYLSVEDNVLDEDIAQAWGITEEEVRALTKKVREFLSTDIPKLNEPVWLYDPTWYIHRLLEAWGLQSPEGWGDVKFWDEEMIISAMQDVIKHTTHPRDFIREMRALIKQDYEEMVQNEIRAKNEEESNNGY